VVQIVVDTVRPDHLGVYGYERPTSPALDAWAGDAAVFENAFSTSSWTTPAVGSILTGQWPSRHGAGLRRNDEGVLEITLLKDSVQTLPEVLRERGYVTGAFVNNPSLQPTLGLGRGFDEYDYVQTTNATIRDAAVTVDAALEWIGDNADRPLFAWIHIMEPHLNYDPALAVRGSFTAGYQGPLSLPIRVRLRDADTMAGLTDADRDFVVGSYDEEIAFVDRQLGRFLAGLEELFGRDGVLVMFTSDHGEELWDHGGFEHGHAMHQEVLRVPLIVDGPGVSGRRVDAPASLADLAPTVLDAIGAGVPAAMSGRSLWPAATGGPAPAPRAIIAEGVIYVDEIKAVVEWPMKGIFDSGRDRWQVFDLQRDPHERIDLADDAKRGPAALARFERALSKQVGVDAPAAATASEGERMLDELGQLGYVDR